MTRHHIKYPQYRNIFRNVVYFYSPDGSTFGRSTVSDDMMKSTDIAYIYIISPSNKYKLRDK